MEQQISILELRKKEGRGKLLTTLIVFNAIFLLFSSIFGFLSLLQFFNWVGVLNIILQVFCLIGIWKWKKIAAIVYLVWLENNIIVSVVFLFTNMSRLHLTNLSDFAAHLVWSFFILSLFWIILWAWAIYRKWHLFTWSLK